jgi:integrase
MPKKRSHGEGTLYQRPDGRWCGQLAVTLPDGRLVRRTVYAKTQRECREKLEQLKRELAAGIIGAPETVTVGAYCAQWLEANRNRLRPTTARRYAQLLTRHITPHLGGVPLKKLTPTAVERWLRMLEDTGLAARTVQHCRAVLRRALQDALRDGLVSRNAAALARPVSVPPPATSTWTLEEAQQFLAATRTHWLWPLFALTLSLGLRQGEVLGLAWEDVDVERGLLMVRWQLQFVNGQWQRLPPKSKQSRRTLPLPPHAVEALRVQRAQQQQWRARPAWHGNPWNLVFTTHTGTPLSGRNVLRAFQQCCVAAGVPVIRYHDLRHATATLLLASGVDLKVVSSILGHSQISITADYYTHVTSGLVAPALERLRDVFALPE